MSLGNFYPPRVGHGRRAGKRGQKEIVIIPRRRRKNLDCFSAIWNLEQAQASGKPCRLLSSTLG
jgi:hypothetical protein